MRKTPAEYYVRSRLVRDRDLPVAELVAELEDELVFVPGPEYVARLRERMVPPPGFRPHDLGHARSQVFLRRHGIWSVFHAHAGTRQAIRVFEDVRARTATQALIVSGTDAGTIVKVAGESLKIELSVSGLEEFKHYFWNVALLTKLEMVEYIRERLHDDEMAKIAAAPPGQAAMLRAFALLGVPLPALDERKLVEDQLAAVALLAARYTTDLPAGPAQAAALRANVETMAVLREIRAGLRRGDPTFEDSRYDVRTIDYAIPDLKALAEGREVPFPVGVLSAYEDSEPAERAAADDEAKPAAS